MVGDDQSAHPAVAEIDERVRHHISSRGAVGGEQPRQPCQADAALEVERELHLSEQRLR
jgi:hypothetical protein